MTDLLLGALRLEMCPISTYLLLLLCSSKNYLYVIQLKRTQGAKAWPVLWLVKLVLKNSVELKSRI